MEINQDLDIELEVFKQHTFSIRTLVIATIIVQLQCIKRASKSSERIIARANEVIKEMEKLPNP